MSRPIGASLGNIRLPIRYALEVPNLGRRNRREVMPVKTKRIEIEGPNGTATIRREGGEIVVESQANGSQATWRTGGRDQDGQWHVACGLQRLLDGCHGTKTDIAEYALVLEQVGD